MRSQRLWAQVCLFTTSLLGLAGGCLVVQPLEDFPNDNTTAGKSGGGRSGAGGSSESAGEGGEEPSGAGKPSGGSSGGCVTNADCKGPGAGEPFLCRQSDHKCVALKTQVCPLAFAEQIADPNAIVFGAFAALSTTNPERSPIVYAHQLALQELSGDNVGGLPDGPKGARRPLAMVVCYNQDEKVDAALDHLVDTLGVKAILSTLKPGDLRRAYEKYIDSDVFYLSPVSVTETVVQLDDDGKIWNLLGQPADLAPAYGAVLRRMEKYVRTARSLTEEDDIRVALVTSLDAFDSELAVKVTPQLQFNFKTLQQNKTAGNYRVFTASGTADDLAGLSTELIAFRPTIIVSAASEAVTMANGIVDQVETSWEAPQDDAPLPMYVLSPYNAGDLSRITTLLSELAANSNESDPQQRFVGISIAGPEDTTAHFDFQTRLGGMFGNVYNDTATYYDATYLLAYAMYAAGNQQPLGGARIAQGMRRLISGTGIPVGPDEILATFEALSNPNSTIEVQSTLGPPSFDGKTGVRRVDGSVFCFNRSGEKVSPEMDTLRYDRQLGELRKVGTFCFSGFFP